MANPKASWGIEIGAYAIKAIRLEREGEGVRVSDFAVIPHKKVLTTPDLDQDEMVRLGLGQFISQKSLEGEHLVMSVPGHSAFARFAKLPPVEPKKVPDIVKFEAVQQIPFPIDQVEWDYETFTSKDSPEIEVGIFAITRERVQQRLGLYGELGMSPETLTLSPVALFNAMEFEGLTKTEKGPVVFLDIGTSATDVVIAEGNRCWIRTFPLGGTHFTDAIANSFKLSYSKAEKLKLEASTSKYAKQIMQAMRPVFSDLLQDLQRSIGYYQSVHREAELSTMVGVGSTFKIPGLRKFLGQQLQIDVVRLDEYKKITVSGREAASFAEHAVNMATAYGLALQGVGLGAIDANLVPVNTLRDQMWLSKTKWFAAAAAIAIAGSALLLWHPLKDGRAILAQPAEVVTRVKNTGDDLKKKFDELKSKADVGTNADRARKLLEYRTVWPHLVNDTGMALMSSEPQAALLTTSVEDVNAIPPGERKLIEMKRLDGEYVAPEKAEEKRRIKVTLDVELTHDQPVQFLGATVGKWLRDNAERPGVPYKILVSSIDLNPDRLQTLTAGGIEKPNTSSGVKPPTERVSPAAGGDGGLQSGAGPGRSLGRGGGGNPPPAVPGKGVGMQGSGSGEATKPPPSQPANPTTPGSARDPGEGRETGMSDLAALAPVPSRPNVLPEGATYYRIPVTFEVELLDEKPAAAPATAQNVNGGEGGGAKKEGSAT